METRIVPLQFLEELNQFLQNNFPMAKVRQAVEVLENFINDPNSSPKISEEKNK